MAFQSLKWFEVNFWMPVQSNIKKYYISLLHHKSNLEIRRCKEKAKDYTYLDYWRTTYIYSTWTRRIGLHCTNFVRCVQCCRAKTRPRKKNLTAISRIPLPHCFSFLPFLIATGWGGKCLCVLTPLEGENKIQCDKTNLKWQWYLSSWPGLSSATLHTAYTIRTV